MENKKLFIERLNAALIECGDGRYSRLKTEPMQYQQTESGVEFVSNGKIRVPVGGDSLKALMRDIRPLL